MEGEHDIFTIMRIANKPTLDIYDWLILREVAEQRKITVADLLKELGRPEQDELPTTNGIN